MPDDVEDLPDVEEVALEAMTPHPRNYRTHPQDQLDHLKVSLLKLGWYRNIVLARGDVVLAGHGIREAAIQLGLPTGPAVRKDLEPDSPEALLILANDNELPRFAETDDRLLTELLRDLSQTAPEALQGSGYDESLLAALVMVTRPAHEIQDTNHAAEWVGMPEFAPEEKALKLVISFTSAEDRQKFVDLHDLRLMKQGSVESWMTRWPWVDRHDLQAVAFQPTEV